WWNSDLDDHRRILIGDHLLLCSSSVSTNLLEARLHLSELFDMWSREAHHKERMFDVDDDGNLVQSDDRTNILEALLWGKMGELHATGFIRAVASTLDCLASTIIGVLAIPMPILTADFRKLRRWSTELVTPSSDLEVIQMEYFALLESAIESAGPNEWVEWTIDYRDMAVHRARRLVTGQVGITSYILNQRGQKIPKAEVTKDFPNSPRMSDVEALRGPEPSFVLTESGEETVRGVMESLLYLLRESTPPLLDIWGNRRDEPDLHYQPKKQWPRIPSVEKRKFEGYSPGTEPFNPKAIFAGEGLSIRLKAAALLDEEYEKFWGSDDSISV
ncbi:hypothetical protein ACFL41_02600, partial [Gemmatimonadota bacterium]